jgi:hypothetical protein
VLAQKQDSVKKKPADTLGMKKYIPTGVRFGTDAIAIVKSSYDKTFKGWEVNMDADFYRYYLAFDYGNWGRTFNTGNDSVHYKNDGNYWRAGIDVNFLTKDPEKNMFFFGVRYGRSSFSEDMQLLINDPTWGPSTQNYSYSGSAARWFELTTGLKVKMWKFFWMGYTARYKFGLKTDKTTEMIASDVPGYGRTDKQSYWGFNYQLFFRIPVTKAKAQRTTADK